MHQTSLLFALGAVFAVSASAETLPDFVGETIVVTPTRIALADSNAPFASEVHDRRMIERSSATTLYDYLTQHASVQILPSYGNRAAPRIDMRGFGIGDGFQNIVITLDGRRLNNIDSVPQLLGGIALDRIERIEITKGSGSVLFGDGATAGSIQIITRQQDRGRVQVSGGNFGAKNARLSAGLAKEKFSLSASADYADASGTSEPDITGKRDASQSHGQQGKLELKPSDDLTVALDGSRSRIDTRYIGNLTLAEYAANPSQNGGNTYTHQKFETDAWGAGLAYALAPGWNLTARYTIEDKVSDYVSYASRSDYDYRSRDLAVEYRGGALKFTAGLQGFDGTRIGSTNRTSKDNSGWFAQGQYRLDRTTLSAGARRERVKYAYAPNAGAMLRADHGLTAWDLGINHRLDDSLTVFANVNRAFQAPDIDRFFNWGGTFNGFIEPAISQTANLGLNYMTPGNRLKLTLFRANLEHEIYYNALTFTNTNLDKTHKYGLELQDSWRVTDALSASLNYTWTQAIIDRENDGGGTWDGKDLPGVPRHGANLGLHWQATPASSLNLSHAWRSKAWAAEDFDNNNLQKQAVYQSTNIAYRYRYRQWEGFAAVDNVFEQSNGIWIRDDVIYPVNFTRNWRVGVQRDF